jgi:hypothetical protein
MRRLINIASMCLTFAVLVLMTREPLPAGGPLYVGGTFGVSGAAFVWDASAPVQYRVDTGALGKLNNAQALIRVQSLFQVWQDVPTANISFQYAGPILPAAGFAGGHVATITDFDAVYESCLKGEQSPVIFDADGSLFRALGMDVSVIGFSATCTLDDAGHIKSDLVAINGAFLDGNAMNFELSDEVFDATFIHEFGHFAGLDHSQINVDCLQSCTADELAGVPTMFPYMLSGKQRLLTEDDKAWISRLYPRAAYGSGGQTPFSSQYGVITGRVLFNDKLSGMHGLNVIARRVGGSASGVDESRRFAVSVCSGFLFTGNPGQMVTGNNMGSQLGSRDALLAGYYELPVPAGDYTIEVEALDSRFVGGSSVGPLAKFLPYGRGSQIAFPEAVPIAGPFHVIAGGTLSTDIVVPGTYARFDQYELP